MSLPEINDESPETVEVTISSNWTDTSYNQASNSLEFTNINSDVNVTVSVTLTDEIDNEGTETFHV